MTKPSFIAQLMMSLVAVHAFPRGPTTTVAAAADTGSTSGHAMYMMYMLDVWNDWKREMVMCVTCHPAPYTRFPTSASSLITKGYWATDPTLMGYGFVV